jgi:hypothetical protein
VVFIRQLLQAFADGDGVVGNLFEGFRPLFVDFHDALAFGLADAVNAAFGQLLFRRHVEQAVLEARGTEVRNQDFHIRRSVLMNKRDSR